MFYHVFPSFSLLLPKPNVYSLSLPPLLQYLQPLTPPSIIHVSPPPPLVHYNSPPHHLYSSTIPFQYPPLYLHHLQNNVNSHAVMVYQSLRAPPTRHQQLESHTLHLPHHRSINSFEILVLHLTSPRSTKLVKFVIFSYSLFLSGNSQIL